MNYCNCPNCATVNCPAARDGDGSVQRLSGRYIEIVDDDDGQPRLIIHTTREEIMRFGRNLAFADVEVRLKAGSPPQQTP